MDFEKQLKIERQIWGHDLTEIKAEHRVLLNERIIPLLRDAIDFLEIEPSRPSGALKRVRAVIRNVNEHLAIKEINKR